MEPESSVAELARETHSSIEVTRNAKGDYQWVLKRYYEDGAEDYALAQLKLIDVELRRAFLPQDGVDLQEQLKGSIAALRGNADGVPAANS